MKKTLEMRFSAALVTVCLLAALFCAPASATGEAFSDVPVGHTFYTYIMDCRDKGILNGYEDGTFRPGNTNRISYGLQALYNAACAKDPNVRNTYGNVGGGTWGPAIAYYKATAGMEYPDVNVEANRAAMAVMIYLKEKDNPAATRASGQVRFNDCAGLSELERTAIDFCTVNGIVSGYTDGSFRPNGNLTRGHLAKMADNWYYRFATASTQGATPSATSGNGTGTAVPSATQNTTPSTTPAPSATTTTTPNTTTPAPSGTSGTGTNPGANRGDTPAAPTQSGGGASNPPAAPAAQPLTAAQAIELAESLGLVTEDFVWENDRTLTGLRVYSRATVDDLESYLFAVKNDGSAWWTQNNAASASMESIALVDVRTWFQNLASQLSNTQKTAIAGYYLVNFAVRQGLYATYDGGTNVIVRTSASANTTYTVNNGVVSGGGLAAARTAIRNAASTLGNNRAETVARAVGAYAESHGGWTVEISAYNSDGAWQAVCRKVTTTPGSDSTTTTTRELIVVTTVSDSGLHVWVPNGGTLAEYSLGGTLEVIAAG